MVSVAVAAAARTAVRPVDGELAGWQPVMLGGVVGCEALERAGLVPENLDEVIVGCADPVGACGADVARAVVLAADWPDQVGGQVVDRSETSGLAAVQAGVAAIRSGQAETVLVLGLGICSVVPPGAAALQRNYGAPWGGVAERLAERGGLLPGPRLVERAAQGAGIGRAELDAAAEESRRLRRASGISGAIVAVAARPGNSAERVVRRGDPVASDAVREWGDTAALPPVFDDGGLLTAATFAPPADAAAAVVLQAVASAGTGPSVAGIGRAAGDPFDPTGNVACSVGRALAEARLALDAVDEVAVSEHDAATALLVARALDIDASGINRGGGAVATGDSGAAEELRLITDGLAAAGCRGTVANPCGGAGASQEGSGRHGGHLLVISAGPTGSAALLVSRSLRVAAT